MGVVLSVSKLTPGQEGYYERSVAAGLDDYYAGRGESPGVWTGRGARELELEGLVHEGELGRLIRGIHPHTEKQLRAHPKARVITIERNIGINAMPITYSHKGRQYVTVLSGIGGLYWNINRESLKDKVPQGGSVWTFALLPE